MFDVLFTKEDIQESSRQRVDMISIFLVMSEKIDGWNFMYISKTHRLQTSTDESYGFPVNISGAA